MQFAALVACFVKHVEKVTQEELPKILTLILEPPTLCV